MVAGSVISICVTDASGAGHRRRTIGVNSKHKEIKMRKSVCVDLDGVLADYSDGWQGVGVIGDPIPGAVEFTKQLAELFDVVIFTCRCNPEMDRPTVPHLLARRVAEWLDIHGFTYHHIYVGVGKPVASAYIDDRAVVCQPQIDGPTVAYQNAMDSVKWLVIGGKQGEPQ